MFKTKRNMVLALVLCALLLPATASVKNPVERPDKLRGDNVVIVDLTNFILYGNPICPWWIDWEVGNTTHLGLYTSSGGGTFDLSTGQLTGSGYITAANGDEVYWQTTMQAGAPVIVAFTGGTGRFEGASGGMTETITQATEIQNGYLLIVTQSFSGIGTITY